MSNCKDCLGCNCNQPTKEGTKEGTKMTDNYVSTRVDNIMIEFARGQLASDDAVTLLEDLLQLNLFDGQAIDDEAHRYITQAINEVVRS